MARPKTRTPKAERTEARIVQAALALFERHGYERTTLRAIAQRAEVSLGLVYRYFPSKDALVLELYDALSHEFATRAVQLPPGSWTTRFIAALHVSLEILGPHRDAMRALLATSTASSGELLVPGDTEAQSRVEARFVEVVTGATDAPAEPERLGRTLYLIHLTVLLAWVLDRSPKQLATARALSLLERMTPLAALAFASPLFGDLVAEISDVMELGVRGKLAAKPRRKAK